MNPVALEKGQNRDNRDIFHHPKESLTHAPQRPQMPQGQIDKEAKRVILRRYGKGSIKGLNGAYGGTSVRHTTRMCRTAETAA